MKKLVSMLAIIAILCVTLFTLTGCGDEEKSSSSKKNKNKNDVENVSNVENTSDDENNTVSNSTQSNETKKTTPTLDKTAVDINNKDIYYFVVNGKKFTIESKLKEIESTGYTQDKSAAEKDVPKNNYLIGGGYFHDSKNHTVFSVTPINLTSETVKGADTTVGAFTLDEYYYKDFDGTIEICNGITIGTSMEDIETIFGEPTEKDMREDYASLGIKYTYKASTYKYFEFEFDKETKELTKITWRYFDFK